MTIIYLARAVREALLAGYSQSGWFPSHLALFRN
jgi:hypothetical protein